MEKRGQSRWELNPANPLSIHLDGRPVSLVNLSRGGVQVIASFRPTRSSIEVFLGGESYRVDGSIVWLNTSDAMPGHYQCGVAFNSPPDEFNQALDKLLRVF